MIFALGAIINKRKQKTYAKPKKAKLGVTKFYKCLTRPTKVRIKWYGHGRRRRLRLIVSYSALGRLLYLR